MTKPVDTQHLRAQWESYQHDPELAGAWVRGILADGLDLITEVETLRAALDPTDDLPFIEQVQAEIAYQQTRWSAADDAKTDSDWFWLVGYLVGKAFHDVRRKRVHHLVAAAAALGNWHAAAVKRGEHLPEERGDQSDHTGRIG